ncbi:cytochrome P450/oxidoreductase [Pseudosulfitobacter sp. DSM 107133]|uniref:cytochrome P450/oxidoreductase n=1 Tax=Pseudosulfitobacter sp. DSM 107133 TaxID=2883100 RepID=UPI000DF236D9|nr:cytochrome P450/oxidoreductase [Pseudosulfitobacter sp. DSM 107133]UOA28938.1 Cytochrome P450 116 [Pseudosulfitobacter sp. DSM 107133]
MIGRNQTDQRGCPMGDPAAMAREFDPFDTPYQTDPAQALAWARAQNPVFYAPRLGYWVVTRYHDIKAVFRDPVLFSPRNVLEKISPPTDEALRILRSYDYGMDRTLVNEDEPAHLERRRLLLDHFLPENLEHHHAMIRSLTRERIDAIIDDGRANLVEALLYEVPLLVALHFLGVPEDEIDTLRTFSLAHSVNTWGRPSKEQQSQVADEVGRFWQYAGAVIKKMRAQTDGTGWMHHTIRMNAKRPDVVTDSYVHSMMMAIIVAAHETTSLASANMFKTLLTHRSAWEDVCANPALIPNAVEECLRYAGSIVAWRRQTTAPASVGGVDLPEGAKLLIVQASGNRDPRHFENGETFDIYRDNAVDHLTFGYGAHQCMGKNIGRMEMRIFLEEVSRRLPHLRLAKQDFSYMPNMSFRGPDALWVEWNPASNPERADALCLQPRCEFAVGAPERRDIARRVRVTDIRHEADGVLGLALGSADGRALPEWTPGSHVELCVGGFDRKYSLCGAPDDGTYRVAILREAAGKGGSCHIHDTLRTGMEIGLRGPANLFRLDTGASHYMLIAGGIGITPVIAMAERLKTLGASYTLHYAGRSRARMAFLDRLARDHGPALTVHVTDEGTRANLPALIQDLPDGGQIYACGPAGLLTALEALAADLPQGTFRSEHFSSTAAGLAPEDEIPFDVQLVDSGLTLTVPRDRTLLDVIQAAGVDVPCDCREGLCGSCEVDVVEGKIDHRDMVLTRAERQESRRMMSCCSRSADGTPIKIAL